MFRITDCAKYDSMTNDIMANAEGVKAVMSNLDAKFSIVPYKFTSEGPEKNKASPFSLMGIVYDQKYEKDMQTDYFAGQLTNEDVTTFL
jgi:hypothetical protein